MTSLLTRRTKSPADPNNQEDRRDSKTSSIESFFENLKARSRNPSGQEDQPHSPPTGEDAEHSKPNSHATREDDKHTKPNSPATQESFLKQFKLQIMGNPTERSNTKCTSPKKSPSSPVSPGSGKVFIPSVHVYCQPQMIKKKVKRNSSSSRRTKSESSNQSTPQAKSEPKTLTRSVSMFTSSTANKMPLKRKYTTFCNLQSVEESQEPITYEDWRDEDGQYNNNH